tara:strand:- start:2281 stop:4149 length:1869 start_codon:yes stop_codon:yes gene_type:complete
MPLTKLQFRPGINREGTNYSNEGGWYDGDKIRFRSGFVERIGGWVKVGSEAFKGTCRKLHDFVTLSSENLLFMGTNTKAYLEDSGVLYDITPIRRTVTLGANPITTQSAGTGVIRVTDVGHGATLGDFVTFSGANAVDGLTQSNLNKEQEVTAIIDPNTYTVDTGGTCSSGSTAGGGSSVVAAYQINIGLNTTILGPGWGAGTWGRFTWGSGAGSLAGQSLRLWFADDFGEDLLMNIADEDIYYWDASAGTGSRAVPLSSLAGASNVPTVARKVLVSEVDRHILCFGANPIGETVQDPLLIRWSSQESPTDWTPSPTNTAGDLRLSQGSEIVTALRTTRQILIWTDHSLHSLQFLGPPYTFGTALLGDNIRIAGPNTAISVNDVVFWMGQENFYMYDGRIQPIPCSVRQYVFKDINRNQSFKFHAGSLASQSEVWWYYCSASSEEIDSYVVYNYLEQTWYYGKLARTAWNDRAAGQRSFPQAASTDQYLYDQEFGLDDGSQSPAVPVDAFVQSSDFDIGDGDQFMFIRRIIPDLNFSNSTAAAPQVEFTMTARNYNGNVTGQGSDSGDVIRTSVISGQDNYTNQLFMRLRGRQMNLKVSSDTAGVDWRLGSPRLEMRPDGRR